jgi:hypothetical protein
VGVAEFDFPEREKESIPWTLISTWPWWVVAVTGDFSLMMKGRTPQSVIEDKVVWITGASQGLGKQCSTHILLGVLLLLHK